MLMLDAAYPPAPAQLVADCRIVGAGALAWYVYGGITRYTPAHIDALRAAGILTLPIVVPGNVPPDYGSLAQDLSSSGVQGGPVVVDLEQFSYPPQAWVRGLPAAIPGVSWGRYGTAYDLSRYSPLAWDWLAAWAGPPPGQRSIEPIPGALPPGRGAWQYAHSIPINGSEYDASVVDPAAIFGQGADDMSFTDLDRQNLNDIHGTMGTAQFETLGGDLHEILALLKAVNEVTLLRMEGEIKALGAPDLGPVLAALADIRAHPAVIADTTLSAKLDQLAKHLGVGLP